MIVFAVLLLSSMSLLLVNFMSKGNFETNLEVIKNEKRINMNVSYSRLALLMLFTFDNTVNSFWDSFNINIPLNSSLEVHDFFRNRLNITITELHDDLGSLTSN